MIMLFIPTRRATVLIPSGPDADKERKHLFILLTDPVPNVDTKTSEVLSVSVSSIKEGYPFDPACRLYAGDHPFLRHESFVHYRYARIDVVSAFLAGVKIGAFIPQGPLKEPIFAQVCQGLLASRNTSPRIRQFYDKATAPNSKPPKYS